jgi:hypothetical protein
MLVVKGGHDRFPGKLPISENGCHILQKHRANGRPIDRAGPSN